MRLRNIFHRRREDKPGSTVTDHSTSATYSPKLPDDVVYELFEAAALVYPPPALVMTPAFARTLAHTHTSLGWIILTHICQRWRAIGLSARLAHLWARVVCLDWKPSAVIAISQRARECPLTIDYNGIIRTRPHKHLPLEAWASQYITNADVLIEPSDAHVNEVNRRKLVLPVLRELHLYRHPSISSAPIEWEAPGLKCARLDTVLLPNRMAQGLRELHLRVYTHRMRLTALCDFLRICSLLEVLDVNVMGEWSEDEERPGDQLPFDHLKQANIVVNADQAAVDVWKPVVGPAHLVFSLSFASKKSPLPIPPILLDACAREMDSLLYDTMEVCVLDGCTGRSDLRLRLSSSSSPSLGSCELLFPTDITMRGAVLSLLPSYMPTASSHIRTLTLDALVPEMVDATQESFRTLGRALTEVENLELRGMDYWSAAMHVHMLRQTRGVPVLPALQTIRISDVYPPEISDGSGLETTKTQEWWDMITTALMTRKESELGAVGRLVLNGPWAGKESWNGREDHEGRKNMRANALVDELIDERVWID
ncbi:hypothetical protein PENSPDRAFT_754377 [Peniophora sp. CONT]|nr:hypothetical protein PENSPDRAFT_754377 [Peniophora sp. CONT]